MPGSVANAAPTLVMPRFLCAAFQHTREYQVLVNEYKNGEVQTNALTADSRKRWQLSVRLTPTAIAALFAFYVSMNGPQGEFYFYDFYETDPQFSYDATGVATTGRYTVRFDSPWQQASFPARSQSDFILQEIA